MSKYIKKDKISIKDDEDLFEYIICSADKELVVNNLEMVVKYAFQRNVIISLISYLDKQKLLKIVEERYILKNADYLSYYMKILNNESALEFYFNEKNQNEIRKNTPEYFLSSIKRDIVSENLRNEIEKNGKTKYEEQALEIFKEVGGREKYISIIKKQREIDKENFIKDLNKGKVDKVGKVDKMLVF